MVSGLDIGQGQDGIRLPADIGDDHSTAIQLRQVVEQIRSGIHRQIQLFALTNRIDLGLGQTAHTLDAHVHRSHIGRDGIQVQVEGDALTGHQVQLVVGTVIPIVGNAEPSETIKAVSCPKAPELKAKAERKKVTLTWTESKGATHYVIYRVEDGENIKVTTLNAGDSELTYTLSNLKNGTYTYKVRAIRKADDIKGYGSYSAAVKVTVK